MFNKRSIFYKLIINNLPILIIPFMIMLICAYVLTCVNIKNEERAQLQSSLDAYVQDINLEKNNAVSKSDYIIKNPELLDILEGNAPSLYSQLNLIYRINSFIEIINNSNTDLITIYSSNPDLLKSKFIDYLDSIPNLPEIEKKLKENGYMHFEKELSEDDNGNQYFTLYRKIFLNTDTLLRVKAYIPASEKFIVTEKPANLDKNKYLTVPISDELIAVSPLNTSALISQYIHLGIIFLAIALLFCIIIIAASITITKKTTFAINNFIVDLSNRNLLEYDAENKIENTDSFELNIIKSAINTLIMKANEGKDKQYRAELEKRRLQLDLLQSKIDPHILYNSLSVISHKAFVNNDKETFDIIENLVSYYRLILAQGKEFTTISEEFDMISKYILINEISHSQKYNFSYEIDNKLKEYKIIHLSLQPFVENAIVHGLAGRQKLCEIKISCRADEDNLIFEIYDNGYGIASSKLKELSDLINYSGSYGIKNTYDRIRLYYGENCTISFDSVPDSFTRVTISIPYIQ